MRSEALRDSSGCKAWGCDSRLVRVKSLGST